MTLKKSIGKNQLREINWEKLFDWSAEQIMNIIYTVTAMPIILTVLNSEDRILFLDFLCHNSKSENISDMQIKTKFPDSR